jgi:hypothetical protein
MGKVKRDLVWILLLELRGDTELFQFAVDGL